MDSIGARIKRIRKNANLTQQKFADKLGLKQNTVASYEIDRIVPSEMVKISICREFSINLAWLQDGKGKMYIEDSLEERYSINIAKLQRTDDETLIRWVNAIAETNPEALKEIESFMKKLLEIDE
ncbi:MAG: helix-turn-helix domain-containing protein [Bacteroides sp.]|nr:helix-turn-helix domain-containing protein [Bacteroides sp.]MCM1549663.1 helix-turn-helix domain-containing protein [Clostridium sp.]